jgi:hypothetical protein
LSKTLLIQPPLVRHLPKKNFRVVLILMTVRVPEQWCLLRRLGTVVPAAAFSL